MYGVRITVMKTEFYQDLIEEVDISVEDNLGPCPLFTVGQVFTITSVDDIPNGFCSWAANFGLRATVARTFSPPFTEK